MAPFCVAVKARDRAAVNTLLSAGAEANIPLLLASAEPWSEDEIVLTLVRRDADVNTKRVSDGNTPLHLAAMKACTPLVDALLEAGADETATNDQSETSLDVIGRVSEEYSMDGCVQSLLVNAPRDSAERAWSRRGFFVLCRAFPERVQLGLARPGGRSIEGRSSTASTSEGPTTSQKNSKKRPTPREQAGSWHLRQTSFIGRSWSSSDDVSGRWQGWGRRGLPGGRRSRWRRCSDRALSVSILRISIFWGCLVLCFAGGNIADGACFVSYMLARKCLLILTDRIERGWDDDDTPTIVPPDAMPAAFSWSFCLL